ncbi:putative 3-hydroxyacyl-CoA dehydrogenase [Candidatus Terasakiella magnetica]|nr:putative 3-hydroxyacyl-CoA dehydrogenase [Candidatus Terasakiella magnetica]
MSRNMRVGVVGAGTMGAGIAQGAALGGYQVSLYDQNPEALDRACKQISDSNRRAVDKGRLTAAEAEAATARVQPAAILTDLAPCDLVVEAVIEDSTIKARLFTGLSTVLSQHAVIATNTSSLRVDDLAASVLHSERFLGLHYFFPAAINPLLEIVRGSATSDTAMDVAADFARATGKQPIRCRDSFGFAVNRFFVPYLNEATRLAEEGFAMGEIEAAIMAAFATAAGPFRIMDMSKPAIALHACRTLTQLGPFYEPSALLTRVGQSGESWNVTPAAGDAERATIIVERIQGAILTAVLEALETEVATPDDIDLGARIGLQWGWQPCAGARTMGRAKLERLVAPHFQGRTIPVNLP